MRIGSNLISTLAYAGVSLTDSICAEGDSLHTLFKFDPWPERIKGVRWRSKQPFWNGYGFSHFSMRKFMALVSNGADLQSQGANGSVQQAAKRFLALSEAKAGAFPAYRSELDEIREAIAYIEATTDAATLRKDVRSSWNDRLYAYR